MCSKKSLVFSQDWMVVFKNTKSYLKNGHVYFFIKLYFILFYFIFNFVLICNFV